MSSFGSTVAESDLVELEYDAFLKEAVSSLCDDFETLTN